ncbi:Tagatose/fructose phosphokinase [Moorella glycerini]|uniref:Tagatose-6-phosphate kinase n=1 Tax=Neomoorella stamsii TaxID=1266720 RepID=A0A9X7P7Q1_9FIRM|nr:MULTISPECIES: 1-phosphofructokinase [Moorella]PRR77457.1 Tagatose-6-phosphate kinase [Moorella stamsii]CEP68206.1 Tagatose/fructose phosphokinase [Moorella glycerini]
MITTVTVNTAIDKTYIVENFGPGGVFRVQRVMAQAGGKGLNVARVVKAFGEEVVATGFIGGYNGRFIEESLAAEGIKGDFVHVSGESRICLNILDTAGKTQTELLEPGPEVTFEEGERLKEKIKFLARQSQVVTMSGSLACGLMPDFYSHLIEVAHKEGAKVILDTSARALKEGLKARPFMVKPNLQEAEALTGKSLAEEKAQYDFLEEMIETGVEVAVLSLGEAGALIRTREAFFKIIPPRVVAVNTVGCGDSFVAGFAVALARDDSLLTAAKLATAVATASATSLGTGECKIELVEKLMLQLEVYDISSHNCLYKKGFR